VIGSGVVSTAVVFTRNRFPFGLMSQRNSVLVAGEIGNWKSAFGISFRQRGCVPPPVEIVHLSLPDEVGNGRT
jgi:hypothetical protein